MLDFFALGQTLPGVISWTGMVIVAGGLVTGMRFKVNPVILAVASGAAGGLFSLLR